MMLSGVMAAAAIVPGSFASGQRSAGRANNADRKRLQDETVVAADQIAADAHAKLPRSMAEAGGRNLREVFNSYSRQLPSIRSGNMYEFAVDNKIFVPRGEYIFTSTSVFGATKIKEGRPDQLRSVLACEKR